MNKVGKSWNFEKFLMVHHDFCEKKVVNFSQHFNEMEFSKHWKKLEKKFEKKLKIKNRENQFVFQQNVDEVYARPRAHLE